MIDMAWLEKAFLVRRWKNFFSVRCHSCDYHRSFPYADPPTEEDTQELREHARKHPYEVRAVKLALPCPHARTRFVRVIMVNGNSHVRKECLDCGGNATGEGNWVPHSQVNVPIESLPVVKDYRAAGMAFEDQESLPLEED